jgi:hypothetical protein
MPDQDLLHTKTLLRKKDFNKKRKEFIVDLRNEHILLTDSVCFVSLEWLPVNWEKGHFPQMIGLRLTDALPERLTYAKGVLYRKEPGTDLIRDNDWQVSSMDFSPSPFLKRKQVYGTNTMISIVVDVLE